MKQKINTHKAIFISFFSAIILICSICILGLLNSNAYAASSSDDKLYGETLSQRGMSVKDCPNISARYSILMSKDGDIIYERASEEHAKIASLTKIMTAIVAIENCDLDEILTISQKAYDIGESSAGIWPGDKLDMNSALKAMLVPSGNDAAEAICQHIGQKLVDSKDDRIRIKSEEDIAAEAEEKDIDKNEVKDIYIEDADKAFCKLMNDKAKEIGCNDTNFTNPHGLDDEEFYDENQYSCAKDIANITRYAMQIELFRNIVGGGSTTINVERNNSIVKLELNTTDILVGNFEGCIGVKTGNSELAGACFSGACLDSTDGVEFYTIVLKSDNETERFIDTQNLFNWYLINKVSLNLCSTGTKDTMTINGESEDVSVVANVAHSEWVDCKIPTTLERQDLTVPILSIAGNVHMRLEPDNVAGSYKAGDKVCELVLTQHNREVARLNLIAIKDQPAPNVFQMLGVVFDRLGRNISNQATVAQSEIVSNCDTINKMNEKN